MQRDTKLGYGFLLAGTAAPYLIDKLLGPTFALVVTTVLLLSGVVFLIFAHYHHKSFARRRIAMSILYFSLYGAGLGALGGGIVGAIVHQTSSHQFRTAESSRAANNESTLISLRLSRMSYFYSDQEVILAVVLIVRNIGTRPSTAIGWKLSLTLPNGIKIEGVPMVIPPDFNALHGTLTASDDLSEKASVKPLGPGELLSGFLLFTVPRNVMDGVSSPGCTWKVEAQDVLGQNVVTTTVSKKGMRKDAPLSWVPGMKKSTKLTQ